MKRYGNLYGDIIAEDNLRLSHINARKGKGFYYEVQEVDEHLDERIEELGYILDPKTKIYVPSPYSKYNKKDGRKEREIFKLPYYPERMIQWAILQILGPILIRQFTADTFSAVPGRGIHSCIADIKKTLINDHDGTIYCLQCDVRKYYPSINRDLLMGRYEHILKDDDLLWLISMIVYHADGDRGIPIGNYFSQYSGNFYLSGFDHWIKEVKGIKYYWRYMDDIIILSHDKTYLHELRKEIEEYWHTILDLEMKHNWQVYPVRDRGIDFVGFRMFGDYTLLRKSICINLENRLLQIYNKFLAGEELTYSEWCSYNSYAGWLLYCDSYGLGKKYFDPVRDYCDNYYINNVKGGKSNGSTQKCSVYC